MRAGIYKGLCRQSSKNGICKVHEWNVVFHFFFFSSMIVKLFERIIIMDCELLEKGHENIPDILSHTTGTILGEVFVVKLLNP